MSGRIKLVFVFFLVIAAAYAGSTEIPVLFARPEEGVKKTSSSLQTTGCPNNWPSCYQVSLPFVAKNAYLLPRIEITHVPPYNPPPLDPHAYCVDGKVLNVKPEEGMIVIYVRRVAWQDWLLETAQSGAYIAPDGSFSEGVIDAIIYDSPLIRVYVIRKGYLAPSIRYDPPDYPDLPPDPPTSDVWAMVEIERFWIAGGPENSWRITKRLP